MRSQPIDELPKYVVDPPSRRLREPWHDNENPAHGLEAAE